MTAQTTPPSLLLRLRDHEDQDAWTTFTDVYGPLVYGYCRKRGLDGNDSADVAQEVLIRVARGIRKFDYDRSKGRFRSWLSTIVHNEISRWMSRTNIATNADLHTIDHPCNTNAALWSEHFEGHILEAALKVSRNYFEELTWRAFELVWIENRPVTEVAAVVGRPLDFVYTAKSRVLKRLSLEVERLTEDAVI